MNYNENHPVYPLAYITVRSLEVLSHSKKFPENGDNEALLFNSVYIKNYLEELYPELYNEVANDYDIFILGLLTDSNSGIPNMNDSKLLSFLNKRITLYSTEIEEMTHIDGWLPSRIYSLFYETPLSENTAPSIDLPSILVFKISLFKMLELLKQGTIAFAENYLS